MSALLFFGFVVGFGLAFIAICSTGAWEVVMMFALLIGIAYVVYGWGEIAHVF